MKDIFFEAETWKGERVDCWEGGDSERKTAVNQKLFILFPSHLPLALQSETTENKSGFKDHFIIKLQ